MAFEIAAEYRSIIDHVEVEKAIITNLYRKIDWLLLAANIEAWEKIELQFQIIFFSEVVNDSLRSSTR
jgi:hypothetical protein